MTVNYIKHLNAAMDYFKNAESMHPGHVSLYFTLFHTWNQYFFHYEFPIKRDKTMPHSKIRSYKTYLQCLKELHNRGLITYTPGTGMINPAIISITHWDDDGELLITHGVTRVVFNLGNTNYRRKKRGSNQGKNTHRTRVKIPPFNKQYINKVKQESENVVTYVQNDIEKYFHAAGHPEKEARKFFFHYQARGWTVNGNPITDWESAAQKWMELQQKEIVKPGNLHVNQNKRYDIPL
jgi:hypothetical protein